MDASSGDEEEKEAATIEDELADTLEAAAEHEPNAANGLDEAAGAGDDSSQDEDDSPALLLGLDVTTEEDGAEDESEDGEADEMDDIDEELEEDEDEDEDEEE